MRKLTGALIFVLLLTLPAALLVTAQNEPPVFKAVLCEVVEPGVGPTPFSCTAQEINVGPPSPFGVAQAIQLDSLRTALYLQVVHLDPGTYPVTLGGNAQDIGTIIGTIIIANQGGAGQATYLVDEITIEIGVGTTIQVGNDPVILRGTFKMVGDVEDHDECPIGARSSLTTAHPCPDIG